VRDALLGGGKTKGKKEGLRLEVQREVVTSAIGTVVRGLRREETIGSVGLMRIEVRGLSEFRRQGLEPELLKESRFNLGALIGGGGGDMLDPVLRRAKEVSRGQWGKNDQLERALRSLV